MKLGMLAMSLLVLAPIQIVIFLVNIADFEDQGRYFEGREGRFCTGLEYYVGHKPGGYHPCTGILAV